jgi:hypothetical protein
MTASRSVFTIVHGTWAREAEWSKPGSVLWSRISSIVPCSTIVRFGWSGRNSFAARLRAGNELARQLRSQIVGHPGARHYVIAHSHGGNVALYALKADPSLVSGLTGIICISTPFLHVYRRRWEELGAGHILLGVRALPFALLAALASLLARRLGPIGALENVLPVAIALLLIVVPAVRRGVVKLSDASFDWRRKVANPALSDANLFIVRGSADEAWAGLAASQLVATLIARTWRLASRVVNGFARLIARGVNGFNSIPPQFKMLLYVMLALMGITAGLSTVFLLSILLLLISCVAVVGLLLPVTVASSLFLLGFGWEMFLFGPWCEVTAEPTPPGSWRVFNVSWEQTVQGLAHSQTYSHPRALDAIEAWIRSREVLESTSV